MPTPRQVTARRLVIAYPDSDTITIIRAYAKRAYLDEVTAAEHLITLGARAFLRAHRAGKAYARTKTPQEHEDHMRRAINARWARVRAQRAQEAPAPEPARHAPEAARLTKR